MKRRVRLLGIAASAVALSCSTPERLPPVPEPPGLDTLSEPAQNLYTSLRADLDALIEEPGDAPDGVLANAYGELGRWHYANKLFDGAAICFRNAQALAPGDATWPYYLAHVHGRQGDTEGARAAFRRVLEMEPDDVPTLVWLGELEQEAQRPKEATRLFEKAVQSDPNCARARVGLAREALLAKDYQRAIEHLEVARRLDPRATAVPHLLGLAYRGLGDRERASAFLSGRTRGDAASRPTPPVLRDPRLQLVRAFRKGAGYFTQRARRHAREGRFDLAVGHLRKAVAIQPEDSGLKVALAKALAESGELDEATALAERVLREDPQSAAAVHAALGMIAELRGDLDAALDAYGKALEADPEAAQAAARTAAILWHLGQTDAALRQYRRWSENDPGSAVPRYRIARGLMELGRDAEARDALEASLESLPRPWFQLLLATVLATSLDARVRDLERASELAETAFEEQKTATAAAAAEVAAMAHAAAGRFAEAAEWQRRAISIVQSTKRREPSKALETDLELYDSGKGSSRRFGAVMTALEQRHGLDDM